MTWIWIHTRPDLASGSGHRAGSHARPRHADRETQGRIAEVFVSELHASNCEHFARGIL